MFANILITFAFKFTNGEIFLNKNLNMFEINFLKRTAQEVIISSTSTEDMVKNINQLSMAIKLDSDAYKTFLLLISRFKRLLRSENNGTQSNDTLTIERNQCENALLNAINFLKPIDIATQFQYHERYGWIYYIHECDELLYKFVGKLEDNQPNGVGQAFYSDGKSFIGNFIKGLRDGKGKLFDKTNKILQEGIWIKDKFMGRNSAPYYADMAVAASKINPLQNPFMLDAKIITIPTLNMENTFVVPVIGDSMSPTFSENDLIICKALHDIYNLNEQDAYVIFDGIELVLKKIQLIMAQNRIDKLMLISENFKKYPMRFIKPNEETKIFQVAGHISIRDKTMIQQMLQHEVPTLSNNASVVKQSFWKV